MSKENQNTKTANYSNSFAFSLVGCFLTHNKRLFEHIETEMQVLTPFILEHEHFNDKETRIEFFNLMESLKDLAEITKGYSDKEVNTILKTLSSKSLKKLRKEANNA